MDAVKFLKEEDRMCDKYKYSSDHTCSVCPCHSKRNGAGEICISLRKTDPAKYVEIVEKWSADHPKKTRQIELLKAFPNAEIENGVAVACPKSLDQNVNCEPLNCDECTRKYWLEEVE